MMHQEIRLLTIILKPLNPRDDLIKGKHMQGHQAPFRQQLGMLHYIMSNS